MAPNISLKQQRELRGWSQARLAEELGTSAKIISRWERGMAFPSPYFRERLCTIFGQDAQALGLIPQEKATQQELSTPTTELPQEEHPVKVLATIEAQKDLIRHTYTSQSGQSTRWGGIGLFTVLAIMIVAGSILTLKSVTTQSSKPTLEVTSTPQSIDAFTYKRAPVLNDPLKAQDSMDWTNGQTSNGGTCTFTNGAYHAQANGKKHITVCYALKSNFNDLVFQASMNLQGDLGGLLFRGDAKSNSAYGFALMPEGFYGLFAYSDMIGAVPLQTGSVSLFLKPGQANIIGIVANKSNISMYVNQHYVTSINNTVYQSGQIGVFSGKLTNNTDATFSDAQVWTL